MSQRSRFSNELETWLSSKTPKTLGGLQEFFGEKSFAIALILVMCIPALPLPTAGIGHFLSAPVSFLLGLEMIAARRNIWLPKRLRDRRLGSLIEKKALPFLLKRVRWFEKFSRPRFGSTIDHPLGRAITGFFVILFAIGVFIAPPFAGLDTLPALAVVVIGLSMILEDIVLLILGALIGLAGLGLMVIASIAVGGIFNQVF